MEKTNSPRSIGFNLDWEAEKKAKLDKIEALRQEYITLFTQRDAMLTQDRDDIYCRYMKLVGVTKYENFKLSVEAKSLKLKVEMVQAALNHNHRPNLNEIENEVRNKLKNFFDEIEKQSLAIQAAEAAQRVSIYTIKELKELYRLLVKRLHPDLHPNLSEGLKDLFLKGKTAYRTYDLPLLREIIKRIELDGSDSTIGEEGLDHTIERLTHDVDALQHEIEELRKAFPFNIEKNLLNPIWVEDQQKMLKEERKRLEAQIAMYAERIDLLT